MKTTWKPLILLLAVLLAIPLTASCAPPLTEAEMTLTQVALVSPTATVTSTPRPTSTPTLTPTNTPSPTPTPLPVFVSTQRDGSMLVRDERYGFQFELPEGWTCTFYPRDPGDYSFGFCRHDDEDGTEATLDIGFAVYNWSVERYLEWYTSGMEILFDYRVLGKEMTTNQHGVPLGISHMLFPSGEPQYSIFFISQGHLLQFRFQENLTLVWNDIDQIQDSIQLID